MIQHTGKWVLAASALWLLAPASPVVAGDQVPIKGDVTIVPDPSVPPMVISIHPLIVQETRLFSGNVSHCGACTGVIVENINLSNFTFEGMFTLVAANGDTIVGTAAGSLSVDQSNPAYLVVTETFVFTGGTGRFAGATGSALGGGLANRATSVAQESFQGTISSPGSSK
jgi:hypothetical protein